MIKSSLLLILYLFINFNRHSFVIFLISFLLFGKGILKSGNPNPIRKINNNKILELLIFNLILIPLLSISLIPLENLYSSYKKLKYFFLSFSILS